MALGTGVHNLSLVVRAQNRASRALASVSRDLTMMDKTRRLVQTGFQTMSRVGLLAIKALSVGIIIALGAAIVAWSNFDAAMTESLAIAGEVSPQIRELMENTARQVAKTTIFSAKEAAGAYYELLSAGLSVEQAMHALPTVAAFAQAGLMDLGSATQYLTTSQAALGLAFEDPVKYGKEQKRVADVLAAANNAATGTIEDFAAALTNRAAASMRTYGIEVEEGVAVLAAWAKQGLIGKTAGEAFAIVTRDLQKAALKEADAWRESGAAVFDKQGNMRNMADIVRDLEDATRGLSDADKKQLLMDLGFQERSQQRILQLLGQSDAIRQFEKDFREAGGTVEEVSEKQLDTATQQLKLLKNSIVDVFIGAGKEFDEGFVDVIKKVREFVDKHAPAVWRAADSFADAVGNIAESFTIIYNHLKTYRQWGMDTFNEDVESLSENLQTLVGYAEDIIDWWRDLHGPLREAIKDWGKMLPVVFLVSGALKILAGILTILGGPATIIAGIIAGLIVLFQYLWEYNEDFRESIEGLVDVFKQEVIPWLTQAWEMIQEAADEAMEFFKDEILPFWNELWPQIQETVAAAWDFIQNLFITVSEIVSAIWEEWGDDLWNSIKIWWDLIKEVILGAWQAVEGIFTFFSGLLSGDWSKMWDGIVEFAKGIWRTIQGFLNAQWEIVKGVFVAAWDFIGSRWNDFWTGLKTFASEKWTAFRQWFSGIWTSFKAFWRAGWETLKEKVGSVMGGLKNVVKGPFNAVLALIESFVNAGLRGLNRLIDLANNLPGVNIGKLGEISLPRLARGADIIKAGLAIVGEQGPELVRLTRGAQVAPLGSTYPGVRGTAAFGGTGITIDQLIFQGTPEQMLEDWKRATRLKLRGL